MWRFEIIEGLCTTHGKQKHDCESRQPVCSNVESDEILVRRVHSIAKTEADQHRTLYFVVSESWSFKIHILALGSTRPRSVDLMPSLTWCTIAKLRSLFKHYGIIRALTSRANIVFCT